uniref:Uncharacterized protein n=1 Tax=Meloidogyne incognita TaxID=6306 RepID=A0A914LIK0_MELIC
MGTKPSKLRHLLHQQKYSSNKNYSPQLNLKKNKLIILKRAVAGASYTATTKWKNNNKSGSIIELIDDIELNEYKQNEENIEIEEANKIKEDKNEVVIRRLLDLELMRNWIQAGAGLFLEKTWSWFSRLRPSKSKKNPILSKYSVSDLETRKNGSRGRLGFEL